MVIIQGGIIMSMDFLTNEFTFPSASGLCDIFVQSAAPTDFASVKGVIQIAHGMAEYSNRYAAFAMELAKNGYAVFINDHLGHGKSVSGSDELGYFGENGVESLVEDMKKVTDIAKGQYPDLPYILFGHSMGSFLARAYTARYGDMLDGAVYCGTSGPNPAAGLGAKLAKYLEKSKGDHQRSNFLNSMAFGTYNKRTEKRTDFDWLSRDEKEVDKYISDDLCGFCFTTNGFKTLFTLLQDVSSKQWFKSVPADLPVLLISGENDPVGEYGKGVKAVYDELTKTGHSAVSIKLYPEDRHEILNELDRETVMADIIAWADSVAEK